MSASALRPLSSSALNRRRWARWHGLSGAVPLAGFLILHLAVQASALLGWQTHRRYSAALDAIPLAVGLEIACVYLPLAVHLVLGVLGSESDHRVFGAHTPGRPLHYVSSFALSAFLAFHLWQFRWRLWTKEIDPTDMFPDLVASLSSTALGGVPLTAIAYLVGIAAAVLHGAECMYSTGCEWGLVTPARQPALRRACVAAGLAAFLVGATLVIDLATGSAIIRFPG